MSEGLLSMWANKTPQQAHTLLSKADVTVTNQSDKDQQLEKILALNEEVGAAMAHRIESV